MNIANKSIKAQAEINEKCCHAINNEKVKEIHGMCSRIKMLLLLLLDAVVTGRAQ